jgi:CheY-like chemotaxis protein
LVSYTLSLLYLTSVFVYITTALETPFYVQGTRFAMIYFLLFIGSLLILSLKEWTRRAFVILNELVIIYSLISFRYLPDFIHTSYIFMHFAVILYFLQTKIKVLYQPSGAYARKSILVVDDDEALLKTIKRILLSNGYSVLVATTGEKGLQVAKLQKPDLIILDVILPGIKGRELCSRLKENKETAEIPVIFLTAKDSPDDIKAEMAAGGISHLTKPVNARMLLAEIRKILGI